MERLYYTVERIDRSLIGKTEGYALLLCAFLFREEIELSFNIYSCTCYNKIKVKQSIQFVTSFIFMKWIILIKLRNP